MRDLDSTALGVAQKFGLALACALVPSAALSDGGAPMLLLGGPVVFLAGQVWIVSIEAILLHELVRPVAWREAFGDAFSANVRSFLWVGVLLPICVSALGWLIGLIVGAGLHYAGFEPASAALSTWSFALTGWLFNNSVVRQIYPWQYVAWFVVSYVLTVRVEARTLHRRWKLRGRIPSLAPERISWIVNSASYVGMAIVLGAMLVRR